MADKPTEKELIAMFESEKDELYLVAIEKYSKDVVDQALREHFNNELL